MAVPDPLREVHRGGGEPRVPTTRSTRRPARVGAGVPAVRAADLCAVAASLPATAPPRRHAPWNHMPGHG